METRVCGVHACDRFLVGQPIGCVNGHRNANNFANVACKQIEDDVGRQEPPLFVALLCLRLNVSVRKNACGHFRAVEPPIAVMES